MKIADKAAGTVESIEAFRWCANDTMDKIYKAKFHEIYFPSRLDEAVPKELLEGAISLNTPKDLIPSLRWPLPTLWP